MKRFSLCCLFLVLCLPLLAQTGIAVRLRSNPDCENLACVAVGQVCITGETIYCCDTVGGTFDPCGSAGAGVTDFLGLTDSPNSYVGQSLKIVRVNAGETALEFVSGAGGTPGGADTQLQFNDIGAFGGDAGLTYNKTTDVLMINSASGTATPLILDRNSATVNAGVAVDFHLDNDAAASTRYARVVGEIVDPAAANEDGSLAFSTRLNGTTAFKMRLDENGNLVFLTAGATVDGKNLDNAAMEDEANVFTLANRFSAGAFADAGQQIGFEGPAGDTHQKRDADLASLESTLDGTRGWSLIGGVLQPPPCPADLNAAPPGFCHDEATGDIVLVGTLRTHP